MKIIQKAVINKGNKFLVVLRSPDSLHFPSHWDFPGGKLEQGEDPFSGIEREVLEETNLKIKPLGVIGTYTMKLDVPYKVVSHRFVVYNVRVLSGKVRLSKEHTKFMWATKTNLLKLKIEPYMKRYFKDHL